MLARRGSGAGDGGLVLGLDCDAVVAEGGRGGGLVVGGWAGLSWAGIRDGGMRLRMVVHG